MVKITYWCYKCSKPFKGENDKSSCPKCKLSSIESDDEKKLEEAEALKEFHSNNWNDYN